MSQHNLPPKLTPLKEECTEYSISLILCPMGTLGFRSLAIRYTDCSGSHHFGSISEVVTQEDESGAESQWSHGRQRELLLYFRRRQRQHTQSRSSRENMSCYVIIGIRICHSHQSYSPTSGIGIRTTHCTFHHLCGVALTRTTPTYRNTCSW